MTVRRIERKGEIRYEEAVVASFKLYPGMLVKLNSSGKLIAHNVEGGYAERCVLLEDALQGKTVNDAYTTGAVASYAVLTPGSEFNGLLKMGQNVGIGDYLISAGDGTFKALSGATSSDAVRQVIAVAVEAVNASSANTLCAMRVL